MALPDRPLKADRGARPSRVRLGLRRRRAAADLSSNACNSRLPSFARSAILLPQPRPQCIARPDDTAHRGPRAARTLRFPTATGRRCACAVPSLTWSGTVRGAVSVRCRFAVGSAAPGGRSGQRPRWPTRYGAPFGPIAPCCRRTVCTATVGAGPVARASPSRARPCRLHLPAAAEPRRTGHELLLVPRPALNSSWHRA